MIRFAKGFLLVLAGWLVCGPAFAQLELNYAIRMTQCMDMEDQLMVRERMDEIGPWTSAIELTDVGTAQAGQVSDIALAGSGLVVTADLAASVALAEAEGSDLLQASSEIQVSFNVTETSFYSLEATLGPGSLLHFGDDLGNLFVQETPGAVSLTGTMEAGHLYFMVVYAGGTQLLEGASGEEWTAQVVLMVDPDEDVPVDALSWDGVKGLFR